MTEREKSKTLTQMGKHRVLRNSNIYVYAIDKGCLSTQHYDQKTRLFFWIDTRLEDMVIEYNEYIFSTSSSIDMERKKRQEDDKFLEKNIEYIYNLVSVLEKQGKIKLGE